jgi:DNA-binding NtrC family response regulator
MLRVLETRRVTRIGSEQEIDVDVRVLCATHRNLERMVAEGRFRQDLLYRLNAITLELPPLRQRREEILPLARVFLDIATDRWRCGVRELSPATVELLLSYAWPGNVRELRNAVERAALMCEGSVIEAHHLPATVRDRARQQQVAPSSEATLPSLVVDAEEVPLGLRPAVRRYEAHLISHALERAAGNHRHAARLLDIPLRTLGRKLHELRACGRVGSMTGVSSAPGKSTYRYFDEIRPPVLGEAF